MLKEKPYKIKGPKDAATAIGTNNVDVSEGNEWVVATDTGYRRASRRESRLLTRASMKYWSGV